MLRLVTVPVIFAVLALNACATDVKGESCGFLDAFVTEDGETYCPDENAPEDCEGLKDAAVVWFVGCGISEAEAEQAADNAFACENAVASSPDFDECIDTLENEPCEALALPDVCKGAVKLGG